MGDEGETLGKEDRDAEYAYEREVGALELEVKEIGQKILHFRRTIPDQFKKSLSFVLVSQRPVVSMVDRLRLQSTEMSTSDSEPLGQQIGSNKDLMLSKEDLEISKKLELLKSRISSNLSSMPLILKRMNDCIARMDKLDQSGKSFIYWLGTEPFLYVVDPEFLKLLNSAVVSKNWGKPLMFKYDRQPMFGNGLLVLEGDDWAHHKNIIAPAFTAAKLMGTMNFMVETTNKMLDQWSKKLESGQTVIQADVDITNNAAEIIARTSFGIIQEHGEQVFQKLKLLQELLFKSNRLVGVPHSNIFSPKHTMKARKLGKEIDELLHSIIISRRARAGDLQQDLLGLLLADSIEKEFTEKKLSISELVDECKTFFFGGFETTGLALTWTVLLLGLHPEWQKSLREEIMEVVTDKNLDTSVLEKLVKMEWVMNEVMRLYSPAPNAQRQAREDIVIGNTSIPKGTNIWIDIVGMHHDPSLWGADVDEFRPERFSDSSYGGCSHKMGFIPSGFVGRMCLGRKLFMMEYKIVLTLILLRFSISKSPNYRHHPRVLLSLRPSRGVPLIIQHI